MRGSCGVLSAAVEALVRAEEHHGSRAGTGHHLYYGWDLGGGARGVVDVGVTRDVGPGRGQGIGSDPGKAVVLPVGRRVGEAEMAQAAHGGGVLDTAWTTFHADVSPPAQATTCDCPARLSDQFSLRRTRNLQAGSDGLRSLDALFGLGGVSAA